MPMRNRNSTLACCRSGLCAAMLLLGSCVDAVAPEREDPQHPAFLVVGSQAAIEGRGTLGPGAATGGSDLQEFDFAVAVDLTGRLFYRDWMINASLTVDAADPDTRITAFQDGAGECAEDLHGVVFHGIARRDTGELLAFSVTACDDGSAASGLDRLLVTTEMGYRNDDLLSSGDIVKTVTEPPSSEEIRVIGRGHIGPGEPVPGMHRLEFDFDITSGLNGRFVATDYLVVRADGSPGQMIVDPATDTDTRFTAFSRQSATCVKLEGVGRLNDRDQLFEFVIDVCDNASPGAEFDTLGIVLPERPYSKGGTLTGGDIAISSSAGEIAVIASGSQSPNVPEHTLDHELGTRWSAQGDGQWIQYDLGALKTVGRVDIAWYQQLPDTWESAFDIEVSTDAVTWTRVFSGRSSAGNLQRQGYGFPRVTCRYVRIIGHGQWDGATFSSSWNSITEVEIYDILPVTAVVASGSQSPNLPENTLDNKLATRWSSEGDGQWIQYDLGAPNAIAGVDIAWYQQLPDTWESAFDIEVSADAVTWTPVFSGRSRAGNLQYQRYEFSTVTCRYVRIVGHGQWDRATFSSWWNSITEVAIHPGEP